MNDKYKLLQDNPQICKRLFGIKFELLETILVKVQNHKDSFLLENPTSNQGLDGKFSISNQLLLTLEYLRQYRSGEPSYFFKFRIFVWNFRELYSQDFS